MTKIINAARPVPIPGMPTNMPITDSLRSVGDSMFGYGAINEGKSQRASGEKRHADAVAKATDALKRGDMNEFMAQSILADRAAADATAYAREAGILPPATAAPPVSAASRVFPSRQYTSPEDAPDASNGIRPAGQRSVWDAAPGSVGQAPGGRRKAAIADPYQGFSYSLNVSKRAQTDKPFNMDPLASNGAY